MIQFGTLPYLILSFVSSFFASNIFIKNKKHVLFIVNSLFLLLTFYYAKKHLILLIGIILFLFFALKLLIKSKKQKKLIGFLLIVLSVSFLGFFKYVIFQNAILFLFPSAQLFLKPLIFMGISFFTFKLIHIIVDVVTEAIEELDFIHFFNFLVFFPCLLSGPFDRYQRFTEDCQNNDLVDAREIYYALLRIILGAFKKIVIANQLVIFTAAHMNINDLLRFDFWQILIALYMYTAVLYFDFSGYSDMAIGLSRLFGIKTPENFNRPYLSTNAQDFWNRWHMSFISWLKDYLYFPISRFLYNLGLRNFNIISPVSFFITFVIAGIWHGDGLNYLYYGIYHGLGLSLYIVYRTIIKSQISANSLQAYYNNKFLRIIAIFITFNYVTFSWFFFLNIEEVLLKYIGG